ncbi:hypothetical protein FACS1894184_14690 [Clostridia bacterium]|nr:hypothetical protein FACS1894184_14690 [Clostridia bacterium]
MKAIDAANFFVDVCAKSDTHDYMTNLRLQKLLFFAQGWSLVIRGVPLFDDPIEAWQYGPVVPTVYRELSVNWKNPIRHTTKGYTDSCVSDENAQFLIDVLVHHSACATYGLVELSHTLPCWRNHRSKNEVIPLDEILEDFQTLTPQLVTMAQRVVRLPIAHSIPENENFDE